MALKKTTGKSASGRRPMPAPKKSSPLPLIIGGVAGLVVLVVAVVALNSGKSPRASGGGGVEKGPDVPLPEYKRAESDGRAKVNAALASVKEKAASLASLKPDQKAEAMKDLSKAIQDKKDGTALLETANQMIDKYNRESGKALKRIDLEGVERDWAAATSRLVDGLEKDGQALCDRGYNTVQTLKARWDEKSSPELKVQVKGAIDDISHGMNLFEWANQLSGHTFDTTKYGQARKLAANKYNELK